MIGSTFKMASTVNEREISIDDPVKALGIKFSNYVLFLLFTM